MEYLTNLIGKQVLSIYDNEIIGTVLNVQFDEQWKRATHLIILSTDEETTYLLPVRYVYRLDSILTVRNKSELIITTEPKSATIINCQAYGISGKSYGKVLEIGLENWRPQLVYADTTLEINKLLSLTPAILLINDTDKKLSRHHFAPKAQSVPTESSQMVSLLDAQNSTIGMPKAITATKAPRPTN